MSEMYQHRLVPANITMVACRDCDHRAYHVADTIPCPSEWTAEEAVEILKMPKEEWDEIGEKYPYHKDDYERNHIIKHRTFSQYLSDLISLAPLKGLTVEEIQSLSEVRK